ncbi:hypothetical protein BU23DRAFT_534156 [Bimuria novae-zelandiae CBS 107.79]|uniref:Uncharacterized protein n=1 Tax=Bimuria novae-zelandiae CBS 107.79 TaxID=1447943 RepID=A0A6A5V862_9PLEO|nr:hypothetical protein BU23DRAFT_534156 [Bimuria novae-zelandiae CBS 107.79]
MSYKVEELLALRDSVSESAVSIEKFADEDRGKAERLLKEHGSPPGMRVTAGGRIVPSDMPPVLNNRFVNNAFKPPALRGLPLTSNMVEQQRVDANNVPRLEVIGSRPVLYVGDRAYALPALNATNPATSALAPTAMESAPKSAGPTGTVPGPVSGPVPGAVPTLSTQSSFTGAPAAPPRVNTPTPVSGLDLAALRTQQTLKKQELRTVEQTEVLQANHQTDSWRAGIIEKKRNLIIELDALRKQITALEPAENNAPPAQSHGFSNTLGPVPASLQPPSFVPQFQQSMPSPLYGYQGTPSYPPMMMFPPPFGGYASMPMPEPAPFVQNPVQPPQSPGSASRRSHAIQIKPPPEEPKKQITSVLDPKSPTYEPLAKPTNAAKDAVPPTPSPSKRSQWQTNGLTTQETSVVPSTPEKNWPASPWNEGNSSRSSRKAVAKLTSWPEAFGKQPSSGSLRQTAAAQPPAAVQERVPPSSTEPLKSATSDNTSGRKTTDQRFGTDETWPLVSSKPISHMPTTYQEGFQAGYDHVGIPDSPDVLKGYIQGLLQFLHDESKKGRNTSLRGLVANSQPQDSAISMTFNRVDSHANSQENIRSARANPVNDARKDSAYPTPNSLHVHTQRNDTVQEQGTRAITPGMYMNVPGAFDRTSSVYKSAALSPTENDLGRKGSEKGTLSRAEAVMMQHGFRQFSGNQITNRGYGTPVSLQGYPQNAKDYGSKDFGEDVSSFARPTANQRVSGLDGAMDDLAEMMSNTQMDAQPVAQPHPFIASLSSEGQRTTGASRSIASFEEDASCFRPSSSKGKQKVTSSPVKSTLDERSDAAAPSPSNATGSPKKSGEHSPAKAKLEQVTNKFRRKKKDPRNLSPEQKKERAKKWRDRFGQLREEDDKYVQEHRKNHPSGGERR